MNLLSIQSVSETVTTLPEFSQIEEPAALSFWQLALNGGWVMIP